VSIAPATGSTTVTVVLSYACEGTPASMTLSLDVSAPQNHEAISVALVSP
jgi:hypothetical protein